MNKSKKYILTIVSTIALSIGTIQAQNLKFGFELDNKNSVVSIPFELKNNLILVNVVLEGVIPLKFIVDTGVSSTVLIEREFADIIGLKSDRSITLVGAAGMREVEAFIINQVSVNLEGISGYNIPMMVLKEDYLNLDSSLGVKVHGILGYDLFKNFIVNINYASRNLYFYSHEKFRKPLWFYDEIPLSVEGTKPYVYKEVTMDNGEKLKSKLMIDTGASHSLMLHSSSDEKISLPQKTIRDVLGAGIAGKIEGDVGRVKALEIYDKLTLENVITRFPDKGTYSDVIEGTQRNGTIGGGVLHRLNVYFNYKDELLYVKKNRGAKKKFKYDMSGMSVVAKGELFLQPYYEIERIRPETPAARAGVKEKDLLLSLNGYKGESLDLSKIHEILTTKAGKKIRMVVKRGDEKIVFDFRLEASI